MAHAQQFKITSGALSPQPSPDTATSSQSFIATPSPLVILYIRVTGKVQLISNTQRYHMQSEPETPPWIQSLHGERLNRGWDCLWIQHIPAVSNSPDGPGSSTRTYQDIDILTPSLLDLSLQRQRGQ